MIPLYLIGGNQFMKARTLALLPVVVVDALTFRIPSASRDERDHTVVFDSAESPAFCSCTCEAGVRELPCWAMARALDALTALGVNNIYVEARPRSAAASNLVPPGDALRAVYAGDGERALLTQGARGRRNS